MKKYTHLTIEERYHIYLMYRNKNSFTTIAKTMNRSISTISCEIKRNTGKRGYRYKQAHRFAINRHMNKPKRIKLTPNNLLVSANVRFSFALYLSTRCL